MRTHFRSDESLQALTAEKLFAELFHDKHISIEIYQPLEVDRQQPHDRDELYAIISGHGSFRLADEAFLFKPGVIHRFENFSDDFSTWVIFYGPKQKS